MIESDFYKLTIGQKIWWKGEEKTIKSLLTAYTYFYIEFIENTTSYKWKDIYADCSLEPPKEKKAIEINTNGNYIGAYEFIYVDGVMFKRIES